MNVLIVGCGVYAMGLATLLKKNNSIFMWVHDKELISNLKEQYASLNISYVTDLESTLKEMDCAIIAVSSTFFLDICPFFKNFKKPIYIGTKGMSIDGTFFSELMREIVKHENVYYFAGPTLAKDMLLKGPVGMTLAKNDNNFLANIFSPLVKIDLTDDEIELQIYSIYKNIMAIGAGIIYASFKSYSSVISYLIDALKDLQPKTVLYGTIGDYFLTGTSFASRNFTFGSLFFEDKDKAQVYLAKNTVEGYFQLPIFIKYLEKKHLSLPKVVNLYQILYQGKDVSSILK